MDEFKIPATITIRELTLMVVAYQGIVADATALVEAKKAELRAALAMQAEACVRLEQLKDRAYHFDEEQLVEA